MWLARQSLLSYLWSGKTQARRLRPRACILLYHRIAQLAVDPFGQAVSPDCFARHLQFLQREYPIMSLDTLLQQLPDGNYRDQTVVITFDDGYVDNSTTAYPIAARSGIPFTVFVTVQPMLDGEPFWWDKLTAILSYTEHAGGPLTAGVQRQYTVSTSNLHTLLKRMPNGERRQLIEEMYAQVKPPDNYLDIGRPMTVKELREFSRLPGITIGAHTMTHPMLSTLSDKEQMEELCTSKQVLEELLEHPVWAMAYPFGKTNDLPAPTASLAARAGYQAAFTTAHLPVVPTVSCFSIPRLTVHNWSEEELARRLRRFFQKPVS